MAIAVSDRALSTLLDNFCSPGIQDSASSLLLPSPFLKRTDRGHLQHLKTCAFPRGKQFLQVRATIGYPTSISWWKKVGEQQSNMHEITSSDQFYDALSAAARQDKLILVDFYSAGCRSCKALFPKICQLAAENPNMEILTVNFYENLAFCRSLNVNVLPFFHFYRGSEGRLDAFSCSLSKIEKLRAAVAKYQGGHRFLTNNIISPCIEPPMELAVPPTLASAGVA